MSLESILSLCLMFFMFVLFPLVAYLIGDNLGFNRGLKACGIDPEEYWKERGKELNETIYKQGE